MGFGSRDDHLKGDQGIRPTGFQADQGPHVIAPLEGTVVYARPVVGFLVGYKELGEANRTCYLRLRVTCQKTFPLTPVLDIPASLKLGGGLYIFR